MRSFSARILVRNSQRMKQSRGFRVLAQSSPLIFPPFLSRPIIIGSRLSISWVNQ
ncbi:hypothetical protein BDV10DRAFT_175242 [Aspergillus recurvatus]